jgi:lipase chaperone LimK
MGFWWSTHRANLAELRVTPAPISEEIAEPVTAPKAAEVEPAYPSPLQGAGTVIDGPLTSNTVANNSLRDTAVDGEISLNPDGSVRLNLELRRMFDYYLTRSGEIPSADLIAWIETQFDTRNSLAVATQLKSLFAQYRSYLRALNAEAPRLQVLPPRLRLQALDELRIQRLGQAMADAFFASERAWDSFTQDRLDLARDQTITPQVRAQRERELLQRLPPELAQTYTDQSTLDSKLTVNLPAAANQRFAAREQLFGTEAARRFEALDQSQAAFEARVRSYLTAREQQRASSDATRAPLRAQRFDANEAARVAALEAIGEEAVLLSGE